jgi:hypothetical protein
VAGVLEHGHDQAQRGGHQGDADEQGRLDEPGGVEGNAGGHAQHDREQEADAREAEEAAPQAGGVDLQPGEKQEEGQSHQGQDVDGVVDLDPSQAAGADDDAGDDLEHDRRHPDAGEEPHEHGCRDGDRGDNDEVGERDVGHRSAPRFLARMERPPPPPTSHLPAAERP